MKRDVELAKKLLESKGYKVSKKINESAEREEFTTLLKLFNSNPMSAETIEHLVNQYQPDAQTMFEISDDTAVKVLYYLRKKYQSQIDKYGDDAEVPQEAYELLGLKESKNMNESCIVRDSDGSGTYYHCNDLKSAIEWGKDNMYGDFRVYNEDDEILYDTLEESKKMNEAGWMINHPSYDPIGNPAISDEDLEKSKKAGEEREKAYLAKRRKEEGAPDDYEYNGVLNKFVKYNDDKTDFEVWNESKETTYTDDDYDDWQKGKRDFEPYDYEGEEPPFLDESESSYPLRPDWEEERERILTHCRKRLKRGKVSPYKLMMNVGMSHVLNATEMHDIDTQLSKEFNIPIEDFRKQKKKVRESVDDRQQRRIVKGIADEVIRDKGDNNSTGTYDEFIRKMVRNWATSGQDRDFIKAAIEKSFDKEFSMKEGEKIPHTEQYRGYSIQSYDDFGATVYKNGKKVQEFEDIDDAREYIDGLNENNKTLRGALLNSLKRLHESLDYEDMRYWNDIAIASHLYKEFGDDMDSINRALDQILTDEYRSINWDDDEDTIAKKLSDVRAKILKNIQRESGWDQKRKSNDPMDGHKYQVGGSTPNVTETGTDYDVHDGGYKEDPESAITTWLQLSQKNPTMISINTNKNAYAQELLQWVVDNEEEFRSLCDQYDCPYKIDYMVDGCKQKLQRPSNFETKYNYPDQIWPFALG